jgi:phosphatidylserine decarboxylase
MKQYSDFSKIIHREGYIFIISCAAITFLLASFSYIIGWIGFVVTIWCIYFFRNPDRFTPLRDGLVISPADGIIQSITEAKPPVELGMSETDMVRISVFLNIFNVHVNRIPASGKILSLYYNPGKFFNASLDKASIHNERQSILMETVGGHQVAFVQIAGLIARRIVCDIEKEGKDVIAGERYGIIRFGSRMDIYLPLKTVICVTEGQTAIGGETIIADFQASQLDVPKFKRG